MLESSDPDVAVLYLLYIGLPSSTSIKSTFLMRLLELPIDYGLPETFDAQVQDQNFQTCFYTPFKGKGLTKATDWFLQVGWIRNETKEALESICKEHIGEKLVTYDPYAKKNLIPHEVPNIIAAFNKKQKNAGDLDSEMVWNYFIIKC
jgi:hypothetical protein